MMLHVLHLEVDVEALVLGMLTGAVPGGWFEHLETVGKRHPVREKRLASLGRRVHHELLEVGVTVR